MISPNSIQLKTKKPILPTQISTDSFWLKSDEDSFLDEQSDEVMNNINVDNKETESIKFADSTSEVVKFSNYEKHFEREETLNSSLSLSVIPAYHLEPDIQVTSNTSLPHIFISKRESQKDEELNNIKKELDQVEMNNTHRDYKILRLMAENLKLKEETTNKVARKLSYESSKLHKTRESLRKRRREI